MVLFMRPPTSSQEGNLFSTQKIVYKSLFILPMFTYDQEHDFLYWVKMAIFQFMSFFTIMAPFHMVVVINKTIYDMDKSDLSVVTAFALEALWYQFSVMGLLYMNYKRKDLENLLKFPDEHFKWRSAIGATYVEISKSFVLAKTITIAWSGVPFCAVAYSLIDEAFLKGKVKLAVDTWYPVDTTIPFNMAVILTLQFYAKFVMVLSFTCGSTLYASLIIQCCSQYDCIFCSLKNIFYTSGIFSMRQRPTASIYNREDYKSEYFNSSEIRENYESFHSKKNTTYFGPALWTTNSNGNNSNINSIYDNADGMSNNNKRNISKRQKAETDVTTSDAIDGNHSVIAHATAHVDNNEISYNDHIREFREALKFCVDQQNNIVHLCNLVEDFFHPFTFLRLAEITLQVCFLAYVVAFTANMSLTMYATMVVFFILTIIELFILTYPAEILSHQSTAVGEALMRCPWYLIMRPFRNDFLIILAFSKRQTKFTALKFFTLNADRLRLVLGTAFSYFTLLSSFNK